MHKQYSNTRTKEQGAEQGRSAAGGGQAHGLRSVVTLLPIDKLREAWITLLSRYHWDLFGTLTFRDETHPESAYKRFRLFVSMLNRKLYGPRWAKHQKGLSYCVAVERQQRGVLHFHVLLADPELTNLLKGSWFKLDGRWANELNEMWNELAGFARIEPIKQLELVQRYVSKYVIKGGEIDLGGPLMQQRLEQGTGGKIGVSRATVRASEATDKSGLTETSASVPVPSKIMVAPMPRVGDQLTIASTFLPLEAWGARASGLVGGTHVHGVTGGVGNPLNVDRG